MPIPSTTQQLFITLLLVLPGFVYQQVRIRFRGRLPSDIELTSRLLRAITTSTVFALVYVAAAAWCFGDYDHGRSAAVEHPAGAAVIGFLAAFGIPAATALLSSSKFGRWISGCVDSMFPSTGYDPRPSAWDVAFEGIEPAFIRVRLKDGTWFAGYFGPNSYASSYPDTKSLYLEFSYKVDEDGTIGEVTENSRGAIIDCADAALVEIVRGPEDEGEAQLEPGE